jgi:hypothetical protein
MNRDDDREPLDARERRCMADSPAFDDLDDVTRQTLPIDFIVPGLGPVLRGWCNIACALNVSARAAQRLAQRGELIVAHERTPGGRGRVWCSVGEVVTVARRRAGLSPADLARLEHTERESFRRAVDRCRVESEADKAERAAKRATG